MCEHFISAQLRFKPTRTCVMGPLFMTHIDSPWGTRHSNHVYCGACRLSICTMYTSRSDCGFKMATLVGTREGDFPCWGHCACAATACVARKLSFASTASRTNRKTNGSTSGGVTALLLFFFSFLSARLLERFNGATRSGLAQFGRRTSWG